MIRRRPGAVALALTVALMVTLGTTAAAQQTDPAPDDAVGSAVDWLGSRQQPDGGFDADGSGVATPDAILALAESAQTSATWGRRAAIDRVAAQTTATGTDPLDAAASIARRTDDPGVVGRLLLDVALPLGLEIGEGGPFGDLLGRAQRLAGRDDLALPDRLDLATALLAAGVTPPEGTVDRVIDAQQANGGWNPLADADGDVVDVETTGAAVSFLVLAGVDPTSGPLARARALLVEARDAAGWWPDAQGRRSAAATAAAVLAVRAMGYDPAGTCWPASAATSPLEALLAFQGGDGRFQGPAPVRTTAQAVHAVGGHWLPRASAPDPCADDGGGFPVDPTLLVLGALAVVGVGGGVKIMRSTPSAY